MIQHIPAITTTYATAVRYHCITGDLVYQSNTTDIQIVIPTDGVLSNFRVKAATAPGAGTSFTFEVYRDAAYIPVVLSGTNTTASNTVDSLAVSAGDVVCYRATPSDTPTASVTYFCITFTSDLEDAGIVCANGSALSGTQARYMAISGLYAVSATEANHSSLVPTAGTFKNLSVSLNADPGTSPDAYRITVRKNGVSQALTCTITADDKVTGLKLDEPEIQMPEIIPESVPEDDPLPI